MVLNDAQKLNFNGQDGNYTGLVGWCLGFNSPLGQYFSLYRAVSQREGERGEKK